MGEFALPAIWRRMAARALASALCAWTAGGAALAQEATACRPDAARHGRVITAIVENDMLAGADRDYTNGLGLMYSARPERCLPFERLVKDVDGAFDRFVFGLLPGVSRSAGVDPEISVTATLAQHMYTPLDISLVNPDPADRPYAGWLYVSLGYIGESQWRTPAGLKVRLLSVTQLDAGVVGPLSGAGPLQRWWHRKLDFDPINGWEYQLSNEPGLVARHERTISSIADLGPVDMELSFNAGLALGNVMTDASAGLGVRLGLDLGADYGPPRLRPGLSGPNTLSAGPPLNGYVFAAAGGRAIARNIFLDGNTFTGSRSVEKRNFVVDYQYGAAVIVARRVKVTVSRIARSEEFAGQDRDTKFDSVSVSLRF